MSSGIYISDENRLRIAEENISKIESSEEVKNVFLHTELDSFTAGEMFNRIGLRTFWNEDGSEIIGVSPEGEEASNFFEDFILAIAPYVEEESYIEFEQYNEDHRAVFKNGGVEIITPTVDWDTTEEIRQREVAVLNEAQAEFILSSIHKPFIRIEGYDFYNNDFDPREQMEIILKNANLLEVKLSDMMKNSVNQHGEELIFESMPEALRENGSILPLSAMINAYFYFLEDTLADFYEENLIDRKEDTQTVGEKVEGLRDKLTISSLSHDRSWTLAIKAPDSKYPVTIRDLKQELVEVFDWMEFTEDNEELEREDKFILFGEMFDYGQSDDKEIGKKLFDQYKNFLHKEGGVLNPKPDIVQETIANNIEKRDNTPNKETSSASPKQ